VTTYLVNLLTYLLFGHIVILLLIYLFTYSTLSVDESVSVFLLTYLR